LNELVDHYDTIIDRRRPVRFSRKPTPEIIGLLKAAKVCLFLNESREHKAFSGTTAFINSKPHKTQGTGSLLDCKSLSYGKRRNILVTATAHNLTATIRITERTTAATFV